MVLHASSCWSPWIPECHSFVPVCALLYLKANLWNNCLWRSSHCRPTNQDICTTLAPAWNYERCRDTTLDTGFMQNGTFLCQLLKQDSPSWSYIIRWMSEIFSLSRIYDLCKAHVYIQLWVINVFGCWNRIMHSNRWKIYHATSSFWRSLIACTYQKSIIPENFYKYRQQYRYTVPNI
jgi:hypothetical protein